MTEETRVGELIRKRRTIRRYRQEPISRRLLEYLADCGRLAPSAANCQPLEFIIVDDPRRKNEIFSCLRWAAYIAPRGVPPEKERPTAYIVVLVNQQKSDWGAERDVGAAMENMILAALEEGIGSCWIGSVDREKLRPALAIPETVQIDSVLALGYVGESPVAEDLTDSIKYWKDKSGVLHVPKRLLKDVIHYNGY